MTREIISLNDSNWRFGSVAQKPFADINDLDKVTEWLPAQVPGDVRLDLLRAGKISDPFYADNNETSQWVDSRDWWYIRDLDLDLEQDERAFLIFDGIDYQSAVFWNGKQLARHVGMFSRQVYEIQSTVASSQSSDTTAKHHALRITHHASLAVRIWGSDALPKLRRTFAQKLWSRIIQPLFQPPYNAPFPDRYATLKCQMQFGWDFAPRLRTCGIWDDAYVAVTRSVFIEDAWVEAKVKSQKSKVASITVAPEIDSDHEQNVRVVCTVRGKNFAADAQIFEFDLTLARGKQTREIAFDLEDARLWNPWDRGAPNLYELEIVIARSEATKPRTRPNRELEIASSQPFNSAALRSGPLHTRTEHVLDCLTTTFGIRSFELARAGTPSREPWAFIVNGEREFLRGANWVPLDAIPARLTRADYAARLRQARDANINFLRVWGGGLRDKRAFYDLCDELGLLVWQEFPFAGAILDRFPRDRAFLQHVRDECGAIVRALRNHPSLVVWCGGNEFNTRGNQAIVKKLRAVVKDKDGTRPFKPASPYRDESHNWNVWHRFANLRDYRDDATPFLSEFGLQSLPNLESLEKFLPDHALTAPHALWEYHHAELKKLGRYAQSVVASREAAKQSPSGSEIASSQKSLLAMTLETFIAATQRAQAIGLQIAIEHLRRRKPQTTGVAVWQFNDCWPAISWSVVDYYGAPKRAYAELQWLYAPVLASFDYPLIPRRAGDTVRGNLWLINDLREAFQDFELRAELNGKAIYARRVNILPDSSERIDALAVTLGDGANILRLQVRDGARVLSDHTYDLNFCDIGEINPLAAMMAAVGKRLMR
jgi:beta-mannosidase